MFNLNFTHIITKVNGFDLFEQNVALGMAKLDLDVYGYHWYSFI